MKIGIDLDGVVVDTICFISRELTNHFGREITLDDIAHKLGELDGIDNVFLDRGEYLLCSLAPMDNSVNMINRLGEQHDIYIISARFKMHYDVTIEWLKKHGVKVDKVIFTEGKGKADICKEYKIDLFIEDSVKNALEISAIGIKVLLMSTEYNRSVKCKMIEHCDNWEAIYERISLQET